MPFRAPPHLQRGARLALRLPLYRGFRAWGVPLLPPLAMSFVVTDRCNSRCRTCHIGTRYLEDPHVADGELSLAEYRTLSSSLPRLQWVTFSGGEPFMRQDFVDIASAVIAAARPAVVNIPTNATFPARAREGVRALLDACEETRFVVNLSCDGVGAVHDAVRGFGGNFAALLQLHRDLVEMASPRLVVGVNSVISRFNVEHCDELFDFVFDVLRPDSYVVELAQRRAEYHNLGDELSGDRPALEAALRQFISRSARLRRRGVPRIVSAFRREYYQRALRSLHQPVTHACYAGFATCTVMPKGEVWSNSQRAESMGNLRDAGMSFERLWRGHKAQQVRSEVRRDACTCELSNSAYLNALLTPGTLARVFLGYARA